MKPPPRTPAPQGPRFAGPRPPSPPRQPAKRKPSGGGGGGFILVLVLAAVFGGLYYFFNVQRSQIVATPPPEPAVPAPVVQTPVKVKEEPEAKKVVTAPEPKPEKPRAEPKPAPMKTEPAPAPPTPSVDEAKLAAIFSGTLPLDERTSATPAALEKAKAAREAALASDKWAEWAALLRRSLQAAVKSIGPSSVTPQGLTALAKNPAFTLALEQAAFLSTLPPQTGSALTKQADDHPFYDWMLSTPAALESWLLTVRPAEDDVTAALGLWAAMAKKDPAAKGKYQNLAIACALVFEKPMQIGGEYKDVKIDAHERYAYYTRHAEKGRLAVSPDKLTARDLVWTVAAPVPESEMEWALQKMNLRQKSWGTAYEMVKYDMERAVKDTNKYDAYTFSEILKKGGICGDRSHFSAYTARAAGIPAVYLSGDGSRGPHAWIAWLSGDNQWEFAGRYGGYPLGEARNPQTGKKESEQEFIRRTDRNASDDGLLRGLRPVWLARAIEADGGVDLAALIFDGASVLGDKVPAVWQAKLAFWSAHRGTAPLEQWRAFLDALKRQMKDDPELLTEARIAEEKFVFPRQDAMVAMKELKKDARRLEKSDGDTSVDQADQIAKVIRQQAGVLQAKGNLEPVRSLYDKSYREHGRNPAVFKQLAADCWELVKANPDVAKKACRDMESAFRRYIDAGGDYFDVTSQMSALEVISACYREVGEEKKAESLAKDVAKANEKAGRKAL